MDVKKIVASRIPEAASIDHEVKHVFKSEDGHSRWWFWLIREESNLKLVDSDDYGDFWESRRKHLFVQVLGR